jgi:glycosyltransferase involved in cell wall biosynthesis
MDRANLALAEYLCASGRQVHLVAFRIDSHLRTRPSVTSHLVRRIAGSHFLNAGRLNRRGNWVTRAITSRHSRVRTLVNGTNCDLRDLNWVHCVHNAWARNAKNAPYWYKAKSVISHWIDCRREKLQLPRARILIANSEKTRRDLIERVGVEAKRVHTIYLGTSDDWRTVTPERRASVRERYGIAQENPLVIFVGAMGYETHKGFDTLWEAWNDLCSDRSWDGKLLVAGAGRALPYWRKLIARVGLEQRIQLLGYTDNVADLLAAADLLVSPVRYEAYGLNVQEAITCGVPAIVSASAGVAERYPSELRELLLTKPQDVGELKSLLRIWYGRREYFKLQTQLMAEQLRRYTWRDMAERIVSLAEEGNPC